jgi:hypothetical protein
MQTSTNDDKKARARALLAARARRVSMLRRRVVAGALASFVLAWGTIATTGSLATTPTTATPAATAAATSAATTSSASDTQTQAPAAVTTSQS